MFWRITHDTLKWVGTRLIVILGGLATLIISAAAVWDPVKASVGNSALSAVTYVLRPTVALTFVVILVAYVVALMLARCQVEKALDADAAKLVDRRQEELEVWARTNFDPVYLRLCDLRSAVNDATEWEGYEQGKHHSAEEIEELRSYLPSTAIEDAVGLLEAQTALLDRIQAYRSHSRDLHNAELLGTPKPVAEWEGYRDWRAADLVFVDQLKRFVLGANRAKLRAFIQPDWGQYDREQNWPSFPFDPPS